MFSSHVCRAATVALLVLLFGAASASAGALSAATDHVVITDGAFAAAGQTAGDVVVIEGPVTIAGRATGDVVAVSGAIRVTGRVDGDLIAVSDRAVLGPTARRRRLALRRRGPDARARRASGRHDQPRGLGRRVERVGLARRACAGGWRCRVRR
jgi:hypothetical protein